MDSAIKLFCWSVVSKYQTVMMLPASQKCIFFFKPCEQLCAEQDRSGVAYYFLSNCHNWPGSLKLSLCKNEHIIPRTAIYAIVLVLPQKQTVKTAIQLNTGRDKHKAKLYEKTRNPKPT